MWDTSLIEPINQQDITGLVAGPEFPWVSFLDKNTVAWRIFCRCVGVKAIDPQSAIDGPTTFLYEPTSKVRFYMSEAESSTAELNPWTGTTFWDFEKYYIKYRFYQTFPAIEFLGWLQPRIKDKNFINTDREPPLKSMRLLIVPMQRRLNQKVQAV
jgi:hypothetical protein